MLSMAESLHWNNLTRESKMKYYKKGQLVTVIKSWDDKGTMYIRDAVVHSCGLKRLILTDANTGEEFGDWYNPENCKREAEKGLPGVYDRIDEDVVIDVGLTVARNYINKEVSRIKSFIVNPGSRYTEEDVRKYHAPLAYRYEDVLAQLKEKLDYSERGGA